jgi:hypothetical protein
VTVPPAVRRALPPLLVAVGVAAVLWLAYDPWYLNYDARYAILWARDLVDGFLPEYKADFAPTPRPLQTVAGLVALLFGDDADRAMAWMVLLSFGAVVWLTFRLGARLFGTWAGVVAALVVVTRPAMQRDALLAYQDVPFAALIVGAVLLEVQRPRRGLPVLAVLAVAGLVRPEAWVLSGLYALYLWPGATPRERAGYVAVAAAAPLLWALSDLIVTGDPLHSLHGTAQLAEDNDRRRTLGQAPRWTLQYLAFTLREPLILGVPIGLAFAWVHRDRWRREALLPLVVVAAMLLVFAAGPIFGLPLIGRYVRTPAVLLALFYGLAVAGWVALPRGRDRTRWMWVGLFSLALSLAFVPKQASMLSGLETRFDLDGALYSDLRDVGEAPAVERAFAACQPLSASDHRPIPYLRWWLHGRPKSVGTPEKHASPLGGVLVLPRPQARLVRRFYKKNLPRRRPPPDWRRIYANRTWRVYVPPGCRVAR